MLNHIFPDTEKHEPLVETDLVHSKDGTSLSLTSDTEANIQYVSKTKAKKTLAKGRSLASDTKMRKGKHWLGKPWRCKEVGFEVRKENKNNISLRTHRSVLSQKECKYVPTLHRTRKMTRLQKTEECIDSGQITGISDSSSEDEYIPPSLKTTKAKKLVTSSDSWRKRTTLNHLTRRKSLLSKKPLESDVGKAEKKQNSERLLVKLTKSKPKTSKYVESGPEECSKEVSPVLQLKGDHKMAKTIIKVDIPTNLKEHSKAKLADLAEKVWKYRLLISVFFFKFCILAVVKSLVTRKQWRGGMVEEWVQNITGISNSAFPEAGILAQQSDIFSEVI